MAHTKVKELVNYLNSFESCSIAVSGGVDSMLLAFIATRFSTTRVKVVHAHSPAVPQQALVRIQEHASQFDWDLLIINANEFNDPNYIDNPVNRCYFCKSNLYENIRKVSKGIIFSGTNLDDLDDFRPGLKAAEEKMVRHPYVEAGIDKEMIYTLAKHYELTKLSCLPAQPCLSSRVETGIKITPSDLYLINRVEESTRYMYPNLDNVRCRITHQGAYLELDEIPENNLLAKLSHNAAVICSENGKIFSGVRPYSKGSAFIHGASH